MVRVACHALQSLGIDILSCRCGQIRMPQHMRCSHPPTCASMLGLAGHPMYVVEELEESAFLPFATQRGHHARRIFLFLEDVSEMLSRYGFYLEPRRFNWDQQHIFPMMPNGPAGPY